MDEEKEYERSVRNILRKSARGSNSFLSHSVLCLNMASQFP